MELTFLVMLFGLGYLLTRLGKAAVANPSSAATAGQAVWGLFRK